MDKEIRKITVPDYKRIFNDILLYKHPEKKNECVLLLQKENLSTLDVIRLNSIIFKNHSEKDKIPNQKHRSYDQSTILQILDYQKTNRLNNIQTALYFKLSRNTITKWKKHFLVWKRTPLCVLSSGAKEQKIKKQTAWKQNNINNPFDHITQFPLAMQELRQPRSSKK